MGSDVLFYATADTHIPEGANSGTWVDEPRIVGDVHHALAQIVSFCVKDACSLVIAGDVVDGPDPDPIALAKLYAVLRPMVAADLPIFYILGNHDRNRDWLAPLGPTAVRLDGNVVKFPDSDVTVTGLSWVDPTVFPTEIAKVAPADVGLYHQTWTEWCPGQNRISLESLPPNKLAVCGDIHVRSTCIPKTGPALALSPGPLAPQSTAEFIPHQAWAVTRDLTPHPVPLTGRTYLRFDVDSVESAESCLRTLAQLSHAKNLPQSLVTPLVAVKLTTDVPGFVSTVRQLASDRDFVARITVDLPSTKIVSKSSSAGGVTGLTTAVVARNAPQDVTDLAVRLIAPNADVATILATERALFETERLRGNVETSAA